MTPLELLAVGVIVVLVWWAGFFAAEGSYERADFGFWPLMILVLGFTLVGTSLLQLLILGIKEAAK